MRLGLIAAREAKGWTQQQLADAVKKERTSITKYETGDSDIPGRTLAQLSQVLNKPMHTLYLDTPTEEPASV